MKVTTGGTAAADPNKGNDPSAKVDSTGKVTVLPAAEGAGKGPSGGGERPKWLPEDFDNPEAFRAAYDKLKAPADEAKTKDATQKIEAAQAAQKVDVAALEKEWAENSNSLKPETLEKLKASGIGEEMIQDYIASRQAAVVTFEAGLAEHVGGKENLDTLMDFAATALDAATINRYNAKLQDTKNPAEAKEVLDLILRKYEDKYGKSGRSATASAEVSAPGGVEPLSSIQELTELMSDVRYKKGNKQYMDMVDKRIRASPHLYGG
jgi:hypothetical protein